MSVFTADLVADLDRCLELRYRNLGLLRLFP
jgi:hypothetical protein